MSIGLHFTKLCNKCIKDEEKRLKQQEKEEIYKIELNKRWDLFYKSCCKCCLCVHQPYTCIICVQTKRIIENGTSKDVGPLQHDCNLVKNKKIMIMK